MASFGVLCIEYDIILKASDHLIISANFIVVTCIC